MEWLPWDLIGFSRTQWDLIGHLMGANGIMVLDLMEFDQIESELLINRVQLGFNGI
jgi:hypothetical protein